MKILVINCSPVRNGATAEIVSIVKKCVEKENTVDTVCIDDFEIKLCKGCRKCNEIAECFQEDDVVKLMKKYDWADRIVSVPPLDKKTTFGFFCCIYPKIPHGGNSG